MCTLTDRDIRVLKSRYPKKMKIKNIMKQKRTIAAAVFAILMFPSGLQAKDNTVPANYVPADLQSATMTPPFRQICNLPQ